MISLHPYFLLSVYLYYQLIYLYTSIRHHRWELPVLCYHKIMAIYSYPLLVVITQFSSWIMFINYCICILIGTPG